MSPFNTKDYICKFLFSKYDYTSSGTPRQRILGDLYLKEMKIELFDGNNNKIKSFGYSLDDKTEKLLPLLKWEDFERTRDISGWDLNNDCGYRDGWGYEFWCINESGNPIIKNNLDVMFEGKNKPAYEKLLDWLKREYAGKRELKKYKLFW